MEDKSYIFLFFITIIIFFFNKFHYPSKMATNRFNYFIYFAITTASILGMTGIFYILSKITGQRQLYNIYNCITCLLGYLLLSIIILYVTSNKKDYYDIINIIIYFITILSIIISYNNHKYNPDSSLHLFILVIITIIMIIVTVTNQIKNYKLDNFFNIENYGYLCPQKKFKDVVLNSVLICPKKED